MTTSALNVILFQAPHHGCSRHSRRSAKESTSPQGLPTQHILHPKRKFIWDFGTRIELNKSSIQFPLNKSDEFQLLANIKPCMICKLSLAVPRCSWGSPCHKSTPGRTTLQLKLQSSFQMTAPKIRLCTSLHHHPLLHEPESLSKQLFPT